jgi:hypothetical protein
MNTAETWNYLESLIAFMQVFMPQVKSDRKLYLRAK